MHLFCEYCICVCVGLLHAHDTFFTVILCGRFKLKHFWSTLQKNKNTFNLHIHNFLIISFFVRSYSPSFLLFLFIPVLCLLLFGYPLNSEKGKKDVGLMVDIKKQQKNGKIVFICAPALNYGKYIQ